MILPNSKIIMATFAGTLVAVTVLQGIPRPSKVNDFPLLRRRYKYEDENSIVDESPYSAFRNQVVVNRVKELLDKELDDGSRSQQVGRQKVDEFQTEGDIPHFSRGLWDSDLPRPNCPDGDDEHVYQVRRAYPCHPSLAS